jgi:hypothetical protein
MQAESDTESGGFLNAPVIFHLGRDALIFALTIPEHGVLHTLIVNDYSLEYGVYPILAAQNY